jgi:predicted Rossmann fold nucleotide-binding protein DprA/Smf involved in DNA uptake
MEINRNELIAKYYALFDLEQQDKEDMTITKFNKLIGVNFENFIKEKEKEITENITLFENIKLSYFQERIKSIIFILEMKNIKSIIKDDFHLFECFGELKNSLFFFYEGQLEFLQKNYKDYVSVVGSRKTNKNMES